jgi:Ca2+-binding EF-hand superfamily protein
MMFRWARAVSSAPVRAGCAAAGATILAGYSQWHCGSLAHCAAVASCDSTSSSPNSVSQAFESTTVPMALSALAEFAAGIGDKPLDFELPYDQVKPYLLLAGIPEVDTHKVFSSMDTNRTNKVSYLQYATFLTIYTQTNPDGKAQLVFRACDVDNSGSLSAQELSTFFHFLFEFKYQANKGVETFMTWDPDLYFGIPLEHVLRLNANKYVADVLKSADRDGGKDGMITTKEWSFWFKRGGKEVARLHALISAPQGRGRTIQKWNTKM